MEKLKPENIDQYIANFPAETQKLLQQIREAIRKAIPTSREVISYGMPAFKQHKVLVYFAPESRLLRQICRLQME